MGNYGQCGQYPGVVPPGGAVSLSCNEPLRSGKYLIVQLPSTGQMSICEVEICAYGKCIERNVFDMIGIFIGVTK